MGYDNPRLAPRHPQRLNVMRLIPITIRDANLFVGRHHRHHKPSQGGLFAVACGDDEEVRGVAIVGRPVARRLQDGWTAEVIRLATDGTRNACSMLYAAAWRACRALGYRRLITFILATEPGVSLTAAGWKCVGSTPGKSWSVKSRPRVDRHPLQMRLRWEVTA